MKYEVEMDGESYTVFDCFCRSYSSPNQGVSPVFAGFSPANYEVYTATLHQESNVVAAAYYPDQNTWRYYLLKRNNRDATDWQAKSFNDDLHYVVLRTWEMCEVTQPFSRLVKLRLLLEA